MDGRCGAKTTEGPPRGRAFDIISRVGLVVQAECLPHGEAEGSDKDGVEHRGEGDDGHHDGGKLGGEAHHGHLDDHEDEAGKEGGDERADGGDDRLGTGTHTGVHNEGHDDGGDALGDEVNAGGGGGDLDHRGGDEADDERLQEVRTDDEDCEAEGGDDEFGGDGATGHRGYGLADGEVEDEAGGKQDGEEHKALDVEAAAVDGVDGAGGTGGLSVLGHDVLLAE